MVSRTDYDIVSDQMKSTLGFDTLGWMAVYVFWSLDAVASILTSKFIFYRGFGTQMPNSPMVICWPNTDGSITISQREATAHIMPTVVPNPPQIATLAWENSIVRFWFERITCHVDADPSACVIARRK